MKTRGKILLIDDDMDFVQQNEMNLRDKGYDVIVAYNGQTGLNKAREEQPDCIVLDVMMSVRDEGFDVARKLHAAERTRRIPIILLTSVNETVPFKFEPDETWLPVNVFLEKPVNADTLIEQVEKLINYENPINPSK